MTVYKLTLYSIDTHFNASTTESFWKHCGKEKIARNEQFLLIPQCFLLYQKLVSPSVNIYDIISLFAAESGESKTWMWGKRLRVKNIAYSSEFGRTAPKTWITWLLSDILCSLILIYSVCLRDILKNASHKWHECSKKLFTTEQNSRFFIF